MTAIFLMLPVSLLLALIFLLAYVWSVRSGQYEDTRTPPMRILTEEASPSPRDNDFKSKTSSINS